MKTFVVSALALTAMGSVALAEPAPLPNNQSALAVSVRSAEPLTLTAAQLDTVTAGQNFNILNVGVAGVCVLAGPCSGNIGNQFNQQGQ
jgi:hypothetical protein